MKRVLRYKGRAITPVERTELITGTVSDTEPEPLIICEHCNYYNDPRTTMYDELLGQHICGACNRRFSRSRPEYACPNCQCSNISATTGLNAYMCDGCGYQAQSLDFFSQLTPARPTPIQSRPVSSRVTHQCPECGSLRLVRREVIRGFRCLDCSYIEQLPV